MLSDLFVYKHWRCVASSVRAFDRSRMIHWQKTRFVYVISGGRRHVKIGHSVDVKKRRDALQTGCPFTLRVINQWSSLRAQEIERKAHSILAKYRWAGEWFDVPTQVATLTVGMLVAANPSRGSADKPMKKAILFCRACAHSAALPFIPDFDAKFRCSKCSSRDHVHVIDFMVNLLD
jgi:hypothetical protein